MHLVRAPVQRILQRLPKRQCRFLEDVPFLGSVCVERGWGRCRCGGCCSNLTCSECGEHGPCWCGSIVHRWQMGCTQRPVRLLAVMLRRCSGHSYQRIHQVLRVAQVEDALDVGAKRFGGWGGLGVVGEASGHTGGYATTEDAVLVGLFELLAHWLMEGERTISIGVAECVFYNTAHYHNITTRSLRALPGLLPSHLQKPEHLFFVVEYRRLG